jgi:hypothetical protein
MSGSSLVGFLVSIISLFVVGAIFFLSIDKVVRDGFLAKIAKLVVGGLILIAFVLAVAGVLGFGGGAVASPYAIVVFGIAVIVLVILLYLVDLFLVWLGTQMELSAGMINAILYVITALALIALLYIAGDAILGGNDWGIGRLHHH